MYKLSLLTFKDVLLINSSNIKCYSCNEETCPKPWNPSTVQQVTSISGWCLTYSKDNQTSESIYARNWAQNDDCKENKCEWRTNNINVAYYSCCCNTNLCNGEPKEITTTPTNGQMKFVNNTYFIFIIVLIFFIIMI
ncbi:unnamed protein product [Rotaria sp. Silwood1]|nr:unnamed protein product [Rotaria sp. Silwood1]CAF1487050.1 unnamed protein product [Rotaria sp. Silwood1]CAF3602169.1 unnamed protein product [Rotaria sp. Silwood1]CAF5033011.1 unnamed protein product [Rotaria sp. Silwood1]